MSFDPTNFQTFLEWLLPSATGIGALANFVLIVPLLALIAGIVCYLISAVRHGPSEGFYVMARTIGTAYSELLMISVRRTLAITRLAIHESIRQWVLVAFAVFLLALLFAGWFLDVRSNDPARLYISFVLRTTTYLVLILALFLSTFSLPNDIKNRTIYTVVTKPVRPGEMVLGRILGFSAVGTFLLVVMCLLSYVFVTRGLAHSHQLNPANLEMTEVAPGVERLVCSTSEDAYHSHLVNIDPETGKGQTDVVKGHWHEVEKAGTGYRIGPAKGMLQARVPVFSKQLRFIGRTGKARDGGYNVGKEWTYRGYIEGGTDSRAIWSFSGLTEARFPNELPLEMTLRVFRTHKGTIERGIRGRLRLHNPDPEKEVTSAPIDFTAKEFQTDSIRITRDPETDKWVVHTQGSSRPLQTLDANGIRDVDLFDLVSNGRVDISIECAERAQYFGMAQGDVYVRAANGNFFLNFAKGYVGIWLQMILVICFGVMFSTFLSGPVAMMATAASVVLGHFVDFVIGVATGEQMGGGPVESAVRMARQLNVSIDLESGIATNVLQVVDFISMLLIRAVATILPNYSTFDTVSYVAYGFDVSGDLLGRHIVITLAYGFIVTIVGYFFLKTREIAA